MTDKSAFNQNLVAEDAFTETSGVLDQLNLPPGVVSFLRNNKRILQFSAAGIAVVVVAGSLYNSYRINRLETGASSLAISMEATGEEQVTALKNVVSDSSGTPSAQWAAVELGHLAMKAEDYKKAAAQYMGVRDSISTSNPMYGLLIFAIAQAEEADTNYQSASATYENLKTMDGYKDEGYLGMARVLEAQGENTKALAVYEEYLGSFIGEKNSERTTRMIQEKIIRLRN